MKTEAMYRIINQTRDISGALHRLVERDDGFRFYLDDAFFYALENHSTEDVSRKLIHLGASPDEIPDILEILQLAGLYGKK